MFFRVVLFLWEFLLDVAAISRRTESEKDLQILLLRQQLRIVERKQVRGPQLPRWQKVPLAALASRLQQVAHQGRTALADSVRLFQPATLIGWHRELVRRKWTVQPPCPAGRPPVKEEVEQWIVRIAPENPGLGYEKLEGELRKLGFQVSKTTIGTVLQRHGIPPAPERRRQSSSWPAISSRSRPWVSRHYTCCFSSSTPPGGSIWPAAPPIPMRPESCSRRGR